MQSKKQFSTTHLIVKSVILSYPHNLSFDQAENRRLCMKMFEAQH